MRELAILPSMIWWTDYITASQLIEELMDEYIAENGGLVVAPEPRPLNMSYRSSSYFGPPEPQEQALALPDPSAIHWDAQRLEYEAGPHWALSPLKAGASHLNSQGIGTVPESIGMGPYPNNR